MSYTITLTNGSVFATIPDGTINTTSSMVLVGKNYAGYGQFINDDIIRLLQNGANTTAPTAPLEGQLWYDQTTDTMKVYTGATFKVISGATSSSTAPSTSNVAGDLWYDSVNSQLNVYTGTAWILVGPAYTGNTGVSGAIVTTITDTNAVSHVAVEMYVANAVVGIFSKDAAYTPAVAPAGGGWTGSKLVQPGLTMAGTISGVAQLFQGTANNSTYLNGIASSGFVATTSNQTMTGTLGILNDTGLSVGENSDFRVTVSGSDVTLRNQTSNGNLVIGANVGGTPNSAISINGSTGVVSIPSLSTTVSNLSNGTSNVTIVSSGGNVSIGVGGSSNVAVFATTGEYITGLLSITGNVIGGNLNTAGLLSAGGNVIGGNLNTAGLLSAGGNVIGGNLNTAGTITVNSGSAATAIVNSAGNGVGNIGSSSSYFNTVFAQATTALYADVAERFAADEIYEPGTVVELGGSAEITRVKIDASDKVFGVISTRPAFMMNGGAGDNDSHPPVAMTGRVPVIVTGIVNKGDRLISAGDGVARAAQPGEATAFNVIGRALSSKTTAGAGTVEAIVTIK